MVPIDFIEQNTRLVTAKAVAQHYDVTPRTIQRWRRAVGVAEPAPEHLSPEDVARARAMLDDGCPYSEVAETVGRSANWLRRRFPGYTGLLNPHEIHLLRSGLQAVAA